MANLLKSKLEYQKKYHMSDFKVLFCIIFITVIIFSARLTESSASNLDIFLNKIRTVIKNQEKIESKIIELESLLKVVRLRVEKKVRH